MIESRVLGGGRASTGEVQQAVRMTMGELQRGGYMRHYEFTWGASPGLEPTPQQLQQQIMQQASSQAAGTDSQAASSRPAATPETFQVPWQTHAHVQHVLCRTRPAAEACIMEQSSLASQGTCKT